MWADAFFSRSASEQGNRCDSIQALIHGDICQGSILFLRERNSKSTIQKD